MSYKDDVRGESGGGLQRFAGVDLMLPGNEHSVETTGGNKGRTVIRLYPET